MFDVWDARYHSRPERALCLVAGCETIEEAREAALSYGIGNVVTTGDDARYVETVYESPPQSGGDGEPK